MSHNTRRTPSLAKRTASWRPIPDPAPVTKTTFPRTSFLGRGTTSLYKASIYMKTRWEQMVGMVPSNPAMLAAQVGGQLLATWAGSNKDKIR